MTQAKVHPVTQETVGEEIANSITHGIGALLAIAALVMLIVTATRYGTAWHIVSYTLFGSTMVILYLMSTLLHAIWNEKAKNVFQVFDHASIYLLIAGTYTPYTLVVLHGPLGWTLFGIIWGLAILGIVFKAVFNSKFTQGGAILSTILYVVMGWLVLIGFRPLVHALPPLGVMWLVLGGGLYTLGTIFFAWKRLPFSHTIWHLFVMAGTICHYFSVVWYVTQVPVG